MIASNMEVIADELRREVFIFVSSVTGALKRLFHGCRRSRWFPLLAIAGGAVLAVIAIKLLALFATAFDISFLRDVGGNAGPGAVAGAAGAGMGAGGGNGGPLGLMWVSAMRAVFYQTPGGEPLGSVPRGARLVYRDVQDFNGMKWYYYTPPIILLVFRDGFQAMSSHLLNHLLFHPGVN